MEFIITLICDPVIMARGVHGSDIVHDYLSRVAEELQEIKCEEMFNTSYFNGELDYSGDIDVKAAIEESGDDIPHLNTAGPFCELEDAYSVLETTSSGNKRLDGLNALKIGWDKPVQGRTWRDWKQNYREKGLISGVEDPEVSEKGELFLDKRLSSNDTGKFYRALKSKGSSNLGRKIEAFILHPSDLTHRDIARITGMPKGTVTSTFSDLRDIGMLSEDNDLAKTGVEGLELIRYQLNELDSL